MSQDLMSNEHTSYDGLLMRAAAREDARRVIASDIDEILARWRKEAEHE